MKEELISNTAFLAFTVGSALAVLHFSAEARAFDKAITPTPIVTPDSLPERYPELIPTPEPTPIPIRRILASATQTIPMERFTRIDWIKMLKELHSKEEFTVADGRKAVEQATPQVACTIFYEAGKTNYFEAYDPYILDSPSIDEATYFGIGQFAIDGKMPEFFRLGYTNPFNPYQVVAYMNDAFVRAQQWAWGPINLGLC